MTVGSASAEQRSVRILHHVLVVVAVTAAEREIEARRELMVTFANAAYSLYFESIVPSPRKSGISVSVPGSTTWTF